jgi:hypothetical protein
MRSSASAVARGRRSRPGRAPRGARTTARGEEDPVQVMVGEEALVLAVGYVGRIGPRGDGGIELEDQVGQSRRERSGIELRPAVDAPDHRLVATRARQASMALLDRRERGLDLARSTQPFGSRPLTLRRMPPKLPLARAGVRGPSDRGRAAPASAGARARVARPSCAARAPAHSPPSMPARRNPAARASAARRKLLW